MRQDITGIAFHLWTIFCATFYLLDYFAWWALVIPFSIAFTINLVSAYMEDKNKN